MKHFTLLLTSLQYNYIVPFSFIFSPCARYVNISFSAFSCLTRETNNQISRFRCFPHNKRTNQMQKGSLAFYSFESDTLLLALPPPINT